MEILMSILLGVALGALFSLLVVRLQLNAKIASIVSEREVLKVERDLLSKKMIEEQKRFAEERSRFEQSTERNISNLKAEYEQKIESQQISFQKQTQEVKKEWAEQSEKSERELQNRFEEIIKKLSAELKLATDEMLKSRQKEFSESSEHNLSRIVNPLKETIDKMKEAMNNTTLKQTEFTTALKTELANAQKLSAAAKNSADELAKVFRERGKVQGDWGETVLKELLESQGLQEGIHFDTQSCLKDENGKVITEKHFDSLRPDVILHLDKSRDVIIDSKVSLSAYIDYVNASSEEEKQQALKRHIDSIKNHVKDLAKKDYSKYIYSKKMKMDYVIMFVPHTGALWTALNSSPTLWREAMERNVFIADEQTLYAALRIVNLTWQQITQTENHEKVYKLANEIMDRVGQFHKHFKEVENHLNQARTAYDAAEKKLAPNGQSILNTCKKLQDLGAKQSKTNPLPQLSSIEESVMLE